jgi:hypothetical protein
MAELNEKDDDEIVVVETDGTEQAEPPEPQAEEADDEDDGDDEGRMGTSEDDSDDEITGSKTAKNRESRVKRRQVQKAAKERAQRELDYLRQQNAELMRRMSAVEGNTLTQNAAGVAQQVQQALAEQRQAEAIMARAIEAGNGDDVATALRIRDEAKARAEQLTAYKQRVEEAAKQATAPRADPRVTSYAQQWLAANEWYDPQGRDEDSAITKAIDNAMAREGWDPTSSEYWHELTRRVSSRIGDSAPEEPPARTQTAKRKAPPTGNTREHAPPSTKNEVVVTPERKQAMVDAGVWDDPVARKRYLKAYQDYDRNTAR